MTIASAIPAAVVSMAVLRALGGGGILENNIVQTGASAGYLDRLGRDLHGAGAGDHGLLARFQVLVGAGDRRARRLVRRVVLGAAAARADRRPADLAFPRARRRRKCCSAGENPAQGVRILGVSGAGRRLRQAAAAQAACGSFRTARCASGFVGKYIALLRHEPLARAARRRLHRRAQHRHRRRCSAACSRGTSRSRSTARISSTEIRRWPRSRASACQPPMRRRRRRSGRAQIRYLGVGAMLVGGIWALIIAARSRIAVGRQERARGGARRQRRRRSRTPSRTCR